MIQTEPNYREICDAVEELDRQINDLQAAKRDLYAKVRDEHGKKVADQTKLAVRLYLMPADKRADREDVEEGAFRILGILQKPRAPRATHTHTREEAA